MLEVNSKKTKIMIFQKHARKFTDNFYIGKSCTRVHVFGNANFIKCGNFNVSLEYYLKDKALHALFSLRKHRNFNKLKPSLACKTFEAMISPILSYSSEIWGVYIPQLKKPTSNFASVT